jgi:hypothetical protein
MLASRSSTARPDRACTLYDGQAGRKFDPINYIFEFAGKIEPRDFQRR